MAQDFFPQNPLAYTSNVKPMEKTRWSPEELDGSEEECLDKHFFYGLARFR